MIVVGRVRAAWTADAGAKAQLAAMTLVGWRFKAVHTEYQWRSASQRWEIWSPVNEYMGFVDGPIEQAGVEAQRMWDRKDQAMWTGRKLEDFE